MLCIENRTVRNHGIFQNLSLENSKSCTIGFLTGAVNMTEPEVQSSLAKLTSDALDVNMER